MFNGMYLIEKMIRFPKLGGSYSWNFLRRDLVAGATVASVAVPQAMAYALIAGLPPEYGLFTAIVVTAVGSVFGSSVHLINGPTNAISLVVFSAVAGLDLEVGGPSYLHAVFLLTILVAVIQIIFALIKLGDMTRYVSESVIIGFMTGAGILVALGQIHNLLGLRMQGDGHMHFVHRLWLTVFHGGPIHFPTLAVGLGTIVVVISIRKLGDWKRLELPDLLLGLLCMSLLVRIAAYLTPTAKSWARLEVVGAVPADLPSFLLPTIRADWIRHFTGSALAIALLGLLEAMAIAKSIAARTRQPLDFNQQCLAEGLANLAGGFFQCMAGSGSLTRSAINYHAGAATRWSGVFAALAVAAILMVFAPLAQFVPKTSLAGILVVTAWRLIDRQRLAYCLRATRFDAGTALATAGAAVFLSIEFSILIGVFLSFMFFVPRAARLLVTELVVSQDRVVREKQPGDPQCSRMALVSLEGELFFGSAPEFEETLAQLLDRAKNGVRIIVIRLKRARNPDMVCLELLERFLQEAQRRHVTVLVCGIRDDFARALANVRMQRWLPEQNWFREDAAAGSSTLDAVRKAYEILQADLCETCPRRKQSDDKVDWYYMI